MVPKIAARGASFKGAGQYYLHDKQADTDERVVFTRTENLPTDDPETALRMMAHTAMRQNQLKAASGQVRTGRKLSKPVYTYSLSWAPDQEPTEEQMIEAAQETIKVLGLDEHEVLMVAHNDTDHPHIHVIANRVHPESGLAAVLSNDRLVLSRWAEAYERENGKILCEQRVENNRRRRAGEFVKYQARFNAAALHHWRKQRLHQARAVREAESKNLSATHRGERQALYDLKERRIATRLRQIREDNRPKWAALFRAQREEWKALNQAQQSAYTRLRHFLDHRGDDPRAATKTGLKEMTREAMGAVFGQDNPHGALSRKHEAERKKLAQELRPRTREALRDINKQYKAELEALKRQQARESAAMQQAHSRQSQDLAREIKSGGPQQQQKRQTRPAPAQDFNRRVRAQIERAKKRAEEQRKRGRDRDGGRERD